MYKIKQVPEDFIVREQIKLPISEGRFHYYRLKKKNHTTEEAIAKVCKMFRIVRNNAGYCGIKDKRAVTEQYISLPKEIKEIHFDSLIVEKVGTGNRPLSLGIHEGNNFAITVRDVSEEDFAVFKKNIENLKSFMVLNLFDDQRFSSHNDEVGREIVKGDLKKAVEIIVLGSGSQEEKIREFLLIKPSDYAGALRSLPRRVLSMYVHAFQARLWNEAALKITGENLSLPIVGFGTEFDDEKIRKVYEKILKDQGISQRDFIIKKIPELSAEGSERMLYAEMKQFSFYESDDDLNPGKKKILVEFFLEKGAYATTAIKVLFSQNKKAVL